MWGRTKKRLQGVNALIDTANEDIAAKEAELQKLNANIQSCEQETQRIRANVAAEKQEQAKIEEENTRLSQEIEQANTEATDLQQRIETAKEAAQTAKREKDDLLRELAEYEEVVRQEHAAADAAAEAARREAASLQAEQETERQRWQAVRDAHEELRRQVEASGKECEEAKSKRDRAKSEWTATRDELRELQLSHGLLKDEHVRTEQLLAEQQEQKRRLEEELAALTERHQQVLAATKVLEADHKQRQFVLQSVTQNLDDKRGQLQRELGQFQEQFQRAKAQHEQVLGEQSELRDKTNGFLPEYFQLQTEHAARGRELEQARRERELQTWEHHKVQRDVQMLSNSYNVGGALPQLPAAPAGGR